MVELWKKVLTKLEGEVSRPNLVTWLKPCQITNQRPGLVTITVPTIYAKDWIEKNALGKIKSILKEELGKIDDITLVIGRPAASDTALKDLPLLERPEDETDDDKPETPNPLNQNYTFETFVVGNNNRLAFAASQAVAEKPGQAYNPLFLYGGVGLGKTHLMQAIGNEIHRHSPKKKIIFTSCENFTSEFIAALQNKTINEFKKKYRTVDVFLIDDIQFLSNKEGTQEEFFHTFNMLHQSNRQIVITADRMPHEMAGLEDRLTSRFGWGMIADIQTPNFETRVAILQSKAQEKGLDIPDATMEFIANTVTSNVRELEGSLIKLSAAAKLDGVPMTREFASRTLKDIIRSGHTEVTYRQVIQAVAKHFDTEISDILGNKRTKELVYPRQVVMYFLREFLHQSYPQIGEILGGKDHTTIMHGVNKITLARKKDAAVEADLNTIQEKLGQK
ncbi:MAG TPA: chromosomal replication initiator protein DnaA [Candidatus Saccharimonadales bacterium]|nr:chromosomal replication initiator protein DnaA [Candidatus Saccharimonadales bacterium]